LSGNKEKDFRWWVLWIWYHKQENKLLFISVLRNDRIDHLLFSSTIERLFYFQIIFLNDRKNIVFSKWNFSDVNSHYVLILLCRAEMRLIQPRMIEAWLALIKVNESVFSLLRYEIHFLLFLHILSHKCPVYLEEISIESFAQNVI